MKISRNWLQSYFDAPLPDAATLSDALTFHVFEIDGIEKVGDDDVLDVKVTANRGHDCLSHRGIAKELSAILQLPMKADPLRVSASLLPTSDAVAVSIDDPSLCNRYIAAYINGVKVGPSPAWLKQSLEAIGQRSINNVVDATNYVMFGIGQPLHAFDAGKLKFQQGEALLQGSKASPCYAITVRRARDGEKIVALDQKEYSLTSAMLVIVDAHTDVPIGIAGVKGSMPASITEATTDIIIESANFNGASVRKTAQSLKLRTDASARFEQVISPELAAYGMREVVELIRKIAGGEIVGFTDQYPNPAANAPVSVSTARINAVLGGALTSAEVARAFERLDLPFTQKGEVFTVTPPFERLDISIPEDLIEEVGRIIGYDTIPAVELPQPANHPAVNPNFYAAEAIREELVSKGYSEVFTSAFAEKGERLIANKIDGVRPYLRANLTDGLAEALKKNIPNKDILGLKEIKLFEIGTVWHKDGEQIMIATIGEKESPSENLLVPTAAASYEDLPLSSTLRYQTFSRYPFIVRDIALWVPAATDAQAVLDMIKSNAGDLLVRSELFDRFEKGEKVSLAFRLIFQSFEKTLTDVEVNVVMENVSAALRAAGYEIR